MHIDTTVIVPTFNEGGNVPELIRQIRDAFAGRDAEVLFVDDSTDDTPEIIDLIGNEQAQALRVRQIHRDGSQRVGGLAGAVTAGIRAAHGDFVVVMDGDLQHPPALAPLLRDVIVDEGIDVAVASRYCSTGNASGLKSSWRRTVSTGSTLLARGLFPRRVGGKCTDPMSGFFCIRRDAVDLGRLRPRGFKILLEILASHDVRVVELPFVFGERFAEESKASWRNGLNFFHQLLSLRSTRWMRFAGVGALGLVVNLLVMALLLRVDVNYVLASTLATEAAIVHNFLMQERFVFANHLRAGVPRHTWMHRAGRSVLYNNVDNLLRVPILVLLVERLGVHSLVAQALTLVASFTARFAYTSRVVYRPAQVTESTTSRGARPNEGAKVTAPATQELSGYSWLSPPSEQEKLQYLSSPQHRWIFVASALAFLGVVFSFVGLASQSYWTVVFFVPLLVLIVEQCCSLRTSTLSRRVTLPDHQFLVETYAPSRYPSVDVFLPTAGEEHHLLDNTYRHVSRLQWPGELTVNVLDDRSDPAVAQMAARYGFRYIARPGNEFNKAGNLQYAFLRTAGDYILILDADFVPREDFLHETLPYFSDDSVGIVQSPQYFSTMRGMSWLERCAGATQELFFRHIQPSRDAVRAAICVGTSAVYRRSALVGIGGFPQIGHSEDVFTGLLMGRRGFQVQYVPVILSRGRCPDQVDSFLSQQYRWCQGSMALVMDRHFHEERSMTEMQRISFWAGFLYYISTAMNAVLAPLPILVMVFFFPQNIAAVNMIPLVGVVLLWLVILPCVSQSRWRFDVLRVQTLYGFAHLFCIFDILRDAMVEWVPTGAPAGNGRTIAHRVQRLMVPYLFITQTLVFGGLFKGALEYGVADFWANIAIGLLGAYIFVPVAWMSWRAMRTSSSSRRCIDLTDRNLDVRHDVGSQEHVPSTLREGV